MKKNNLIGALLIKKIPLNRYLLIMRTTIILLFTFVFCGMAEQGSARNAIFKDNFSKVTQQTRKKITGNVVDAQGESIIGANIIEVGTASNGTITDFDGNFSLEVQDNAVIRVSYIGYIDQEINTAGKTTFNIVLKEDTKTLDEVVVVGYGVQKKSDLTGAVASVKGKDILKATPTGNMGEALQGQLAGVSVSNSGNPLSGSTIRVRGMNSITAETGPLIVIDGFIGGSFQNINPADVQSIEVLKDASATAVYGSRGANGVILITTKNGEKGALNISVNSYVSFKQLSKYPDMLSPYELATLSNEYGKEYYESQGKKAKVFYSQEDLDAIKNGEKGYDYIHHMFRSPAIDQNYELSLSGGSDKATVLASLKYQENQGVVEKSDASRLNYRLRSDFVIKEWLKAGMNLYGYYKKTSSPRLAAYDGLLIQGMYFPNTVNPINEKGEYNNLFPVSKVGSYNPMGHIWNVNNSGEEFKLNGQAYVDITLMSGLTFRSQLGLNYNNGLDLSLENSTSYTNFKYNYTRASAVSNNGIGWLNTNILSYVKDFNKNHRLNATLVFEQSYGNSYRHNTQARDLAFPDELGYNALGWADKFDGDSYRSINTLESGLARINYVFMNRYMFTASIRADGSSRLEDKWDYFPSAAIAWDLKQEDFLQKMDKLSALKLRVGYGVVGNQAVEAYRIYSKMVPVLLGGGSNSYTVGRPAAPDLRWERNQQVNVGVDLGFLKGRFTLSADWYDKQSKDILLEVRQPDQMGFPQLLKNAGEIRNTGVEITLGGLLIEQRDLSWRTQLNLTRNIGKFTKIPTLDHTQILAGNYGNKIFKLIEDKKIASFWGLTYQGVWQQDEVSKPFIDSKGKETGKTMADVYGIKPGNAKYLDVNKDGKLNDEDKSIIGNGQPQFSWGWNNSIRFKDFDLSVFLIGFHGFDIYNATDMIGYGGVSGQHVDAVTPKRSFLNRWTPTNTNTDIPGFIHEKKPVNDFNTRFVEKGDFVKFKSLTLGYTLKENLSKKLGVNSARCYISGQNLFTITKYSGLDPEASLGSPLTQGVDWGAYPNTRNIVVGLELSF